MSNLTKLQLLKNSTTKQDVARLLNLKPSFLTRTLYIDDPDKKYTKFEISKKSGGERTIFAPNPQLKDIQSRLADLLMDCKAEILIKSQTKNCLSHGFEREKSILTNAELHRNKRVLLNIDIKDFFPSINFGRVRGFFLKNVNFKLNKNVATLIAKIACHDNQLPQGSPCSPVISNLIAQSLDIRLSRIAKKNNAAYTRYADDITFSTREKNLSKSIAFIKDDEVKIGKSVYKELTRSGFSINDKKTRLNLNISRQDVTGIVVNKKLNVKSEYWRNVRAMCHSLYTKGTYTYEDNDGELAEGNISHIYGMLNFIDYVDKYNNNLPKGHVKPTYKAEPYPIDKYPLLNVRERNFSKFLFYKNFHANTKPTILCEGKTDIIYLKEAIKSLGNKHKYLCQKKADETEYLVDFLKYNNRTRYLLGLYGGTSYLKHFIQHYVDKGKHIKNQKPAHPVIIILDNDDGPKDIVSLIASNKSHPLFKKNDQIRNSDFVHIVGNLYVVFTPLNNGKPQTAMEDFFYPDTLQIKVGNKKFNPKNESDTATEYGKNIFSIAVVKKMNDRINFDLFTPILKRLELVIDHYSIHK